MAFNCYTPMAMAFRSTMRRVRAQLEVFDDFWFAIGTLIPRTKLGSLFFLSFAIWNSGCAVLRPAGEKPIGKFGRLGIATCPADDGIRILDVTDEFPAGKAGIKAGDVLVNINGSDLSKAENRKQSLWPIRSGKQLDLTVKRRDQLVEYKILPKESDMYALHPIFFALADEQMSGKKISVAFVVTDVTHTGNASSSDAAAAWKTGIKAGMETYFESMLLNPDMMRCGNYSVVDRNKTNEILGELHFQMTGAVDSHMMKQVGKMTGATHLLFASMTRFGSPSEGWKDSTNLRLVDLELGVVLATGRTDQDVKQ